MSFSEVFRQKGNCGKVAAKLRQKIANHEINEALKKGDICEAIKRDYPDISDTIKRSMKMIQLTDKIAIAADEHQYIVGKPTQRQAKDGTSRTRINNPRYYTTLATALESAVSLSLRNGVSDGTITTLRDLIAEQKRIQDEFTRLIEPLNV